jgi:hypothetical protein
MPASASRIRSWVPSVEPVSEMTQVSIRPCTEARQRSMTPDSFLTIMHKQMEGFTAATLCGRSVRG